jgi:hypothetical protein
LCLIEHWENARILEYRESVWEKNMGVWGEQAKPSLPRPEFLKGQQLRPMEEM